MQSSPKVTIKRFLRKLGYEVRRTPRSAPGKERRSARQPSSQLHQYLTSDGAFDYDRYRRVQTEGNQRKIGLVWALEENIAFLASYVKSLLGSPRFGICHGTRRGKEQEWFRKHLKCEVIGTEISDTATQFPHTIQWDFHEAKPEWIDATDFIYSNAFDHSYDPEKCLNVWMACVKRGGLCVLEHSSVHSSAEASELDPFRADLALMPFLITKWGQGRYCVREMLSAPVKNPRLQSLDFIVIQRL